MPFKNDKQTNISVLAIIMVVILIFYSARLYSLQVINADKYSSASGSTSVRTAVIKAPRGEILDRYGRKIAVNRDGYNIVFNKAYTKDNLNDVILSLCALLSSKNTEWNDELPLETSAPYNFKEGEKTDKLIKLLKLAHYATAENCFDRLVEKYDLKKYSSDEQRTIMGVRYSMDIADFSISYPYNFAEDVSADIMRAVSESGFMLSGVTVEVVPFREYTDTSLAVNLIGSVGPIYEQDWDDPEKGENYKAKGYSYNDKVGTSGIEYYAEKYLRGTDGQLTYYIDASGNIIKSEVTKAPVAGKTIMLTLDKTIQRTAQNKLEETVKELKSQGGTCVAGSAVMMDISSGRVICAANYPTYDSATLGENINSLLKDPAKPMTNRAFKGVYPIGSTIKPAVAVAALQNNLYTQGETIKCVMTYDYFADYKPKCLHYHGNMNLTSALSKSCNYFFFELGRRVGALTLTDYFKQFGLGVKTGVEVDDSKGLLNEPKTNGFGGDTLQIAIGQLNAFTPLQLCNYVATLSNGGTHYKATLIDKIMSYDMSETFDECKPEAVNTVEISKKNLEAVKLGMLSVTVDGTGRTALGDYPIKLGGKTGTSQNNNGADHSTYILFAPYDNPEIAISVILEHGNSGSAAGSIVRSLLDAYFYASGNASAPASPYVVLS